MTRLHRRMVKDMQLRGFAERTQETYLREVRKLCEHVDKSPGKITEDELREYFLHLKNEHGFAASSMKVAYCGVKFFFTFTLKREWSTLALVRARKEARLPVVLEVEEVRRIIGAADGLHNRAFFWTAYSCGLRLQEAVNLQVRDIDGDRMMLHVHRGKGARDRYVPLPQSTLRGLRIYWKTRRNPVWLFPFLGHARNQGPTATRPMNSRSLQDAPRRVVTGLSFKKRVTMHTLRHSYATHLLEAGVGLRLLQQYLGRKSMATTFIYCHLTKMGHDAARSAIDGLMDRKGGRNGDAR